MDPNTSTNSATRATVRLAIACRSTAATTAGRAATPLTVRPSLAKAWKLPTLPGGAGSMTPMIKKHRQTKPAVSDAVSSTPRTMTAVPRALKIQ
jgi:hypothetical protein